ncbi:hypothetical protein [uncultured Nostoc sp.]|uniref:hypothetical protein n=1 Tax=uncultured Nostoc sp. TaxID=340711 RepID=UPI0035CB35D5
MPPKRAIAPVSQTSAFRPFGTLITTSGREIMTHPNYTRDLLENFSRTQLHEICDHLSIKSRRSRNIQSSGVSP